MNFTKKGQVFKVLSSDLIVFTPKDKNKINNFTSGMFVVITEKRMTQVDEIINDESLDGLTELEFYSCSGSVFVPDIK